MVLRKDYRGRMQGPLYIRNRGHMANNPNNPNDLASALRRNASGQTVQVSPLDKKPKDLSQLMQQTGQEAAPLTPAGAGALGANPDQQKMMGTPAQKKAALEQAPDLATALRTQQARTQATSQEASGMKTAMQAQALSSLPSRVQSLVSGEISKAQTTSINTDNLVSGTAAGAGAPKIPAGSESQAKTLLTRLKNNPSDNQAFLELNKLLGGTLGNELKPEQITAMYGSVTDAIAKGVGGNVDKDITVSDLLERGNIGYTPDQLADLLNLPLDQVNNLSVEGLKQRIDQVNQEEIGGMTESNTQAMSSANLSQAERAEALQARKEQDAVGVTASAADFNRVEDSIKNAEKVKFNGRDYSVEELLKDGGIQKSITEYLNAPEGSQARLDLEKNEPALAKYINDNKAVLEGAVKAVGTGAQAFNDIQKQNMALGDVAKKLNPSLTKGFKFAAGGELSASAASSSGSPLIDSLRGVPADRLDTTVAILNQAAEQFPGVVEGLNNLSVDQINKWDISNPNGPFQTRFLPTARLAQSLASTQDPSTIASLVSPGSGSWDEIKKKYQEMRAAAQMGLGKPPPGAWDTNGDGSLDSPEMIRDNILTSLGGAFNLNVEPTSYKPAENVVIPKVSGNSKINEGLAGKLVKAGVVGGSSIDVGKLNFNDIDDNELSNLKVMAAQWSSSNRDRIQAEIERRKRAKDQEARRLAEKDRKEFEDKARQGYTGQLILGDTQNVTPITGAGNASVSNSMEPASVGSFRI